MHKPLLVAWGALLLTGCAFGNVRAKEVGALGPYRQMAVKAMTVSGVSAPPEVGDQLLAGLQRGLEPWNQKRGPGPITPDTTLEVQPELLEIHVAPKNGAAPAPVAEAANLLGISRAVEANRIQLLLLLRAPGTSEPVGELTWEGAAGGTLSELMDRAGTGAGQALAQEMLERRDQYVTRYAGDERNVFSPTARLLEPGAFVLADDEVLMLHLGAGVTRWLEVGISAGGLPIPGAGGFALAGHGVLGAGGAGVALVGAVAAGVKVRLLEEGLYWPAVAVSYDLWDGFGAALGGAGIFIAGNGIAGAAGAGAAFANVQLNVASLVASKRFGAFEVSAGATVVDNHHFLPQSASFAAGVTTGDVFGASYDLDQLPTLYFPFATVSASPFPWLRLMQEFFPQRPFVNSFGTTGIRLVIGPFPLSPFRFKVDAAIAEVYDNEGSEKGIVPLPWVGIGIYAL